MSYNDQVESYLIISFLSKGGSLVDCFRVDNSALDPPVILRIFYQMARAVAHMHTQSPPIAHRDIKVIGNCKCLM